MKIDMNKDYVITINREVGSGGRTVSRMLAQRLGVPFYDKALINALTEMYPSLLRPLAQLPFTSHMSSGIVILQLNWL